MKIIEHWIVNDYGVKRHLVLTEDGYFIHANDDYFPTSNQRAKELLA